MNGQSTSKLYAEVISTDYEAYVDHSIRSDWPQVAAPRMILQLGSLWNHCLLSCHMHLLQHSRLLSSLCSDFDVFTMGGALLLTLSLDHHGNLMGRIDARAQGRIVQSMCELLDLSSRIVLLAMLDVEAKHSAMQRRGPSSLWDFIYNINYYITHS